LGVSHFKALFAEKEHESIEDMLHLLRLFPKMLDQEDNKYFFKEITLEELCGVLDTLKKTKVLAQMAGL
jgi:inhibitor of KinA sporulation pathway (predicted exonuclease)